MVASIGKGTVARYYLRRTEYYLTGREPAGVWFSTSSALGITAGKLVEADLFEKLHAGLGADGKPLLANDGGKKERVAGYDLTLSAPKSVSILYAIADPATRAAIEQVQMEASQAVVAMLDREAAFTRRGKNGVIIEKASLVVAAFQHGEARPAPHADGRVFADMDLHTHLCIANLAERPRENPRDAVSFGALDGRALYAHKMAAGSVYHLALASGLQRLGFSVEVTGKNGIFDLVNPNGGPAVDEETARYFSARRSQIEDRLADYDFVTGDAQQLAAAVGRATRLSKANTEQDRFQLWAERAAEHDIEVATFAERLRGPGLPNERAREELIAERLAQLPLQLTENESVFERRTLLAAVATALVGTGVESGRLDAEVNRLIDSQAVVALSHDIYGHGLYSTPEMIAIERNLLTVTQRLSRRHWTRADPKRVEQISQNYGLSEEQTAAAYAATDNKSLVIVEGAAGSGKTTTLKVVVDCYRAAGKTMLGGATAWRTAQMLHDELGIDAFAVDSLLARIEAGQPVLDQNTVLLIDECGQIGSRGMNRLLTAAAKARAKIIMVGDREQLQPISAGASLKILTSVIAPTRIDKIVRQRAEWAQAAATAFAKGDAASGLAAYARNGLLESCVGAKATITAAVDRYMQAKQAAPTLTHLLIAKSNKVARALNAEIRNRMRADNVLTGPDHMIKAGDASGRAFTLPLAVGDHIRFGRRQDNIGDGVINGTVGRIEKIEELDGKHLLIEATIDQKRVSFSTEALQDQAGRVRLSHNLAVTAYSSQGLTAETATVVLEAGFDRHDSYVAMSRSRGNTTILYDAELLSAKMNAAQELGTKKLEITGEERLAFLAQSISRANLKTSTLAFGEPDHTVSQNARRASRDIQERSLG